MPMIGLPILILAAHCNSPANGNECIRYASCEEGVVYEFRGTAHIEFEGSFIRVKSSDDILHLNLNPETDDPEKKHNVLWDRITSWSKMNGECVQVVGTYSLKLTGGHSEDKLTGLHNLRQLVPCDE